MATPGIARELGSAREEELDRRVARPRGTEPADYGPLVSLLVGIVLIVGICPPILP
jgi:hypothetical protein